VAPEGGAQDSQTGKLKLRNWTGAQWKKKKEDGVGTTREKIGHLNLKWVVGGGRRQIQGEIYDMVLGHLSTLKDCGLKIDDRWVRNTSSSSSSSSVSLSACCCGCIVWNRSTIMHRCQTQGPDNIYMNIYRCIQYIYTLYLSIYLSIYIYIYIYISSPVIEWCLSGAPGVSDLKQMDSPLPGGGW